MTGSLPSFVNEHQVDLSAVHCMPLAGVLQRHAVDSERGLSHEQAEERLSRFGTNVLPMAAPRATWLRFLDQFRSLLIIVLIVAAALAALVGNLKDTAAIVTVVLLNAALGFYQEHRAEKSLAALRNMLPVRAKVGATGQLLKSKRAGSCGARVTARSEGHWCGAARRSARQAPKHGFHEHAGDPGTRQDCRDTNSCLYRHGQNFERVGSSW
jgi:hypothetical protein